MGKTMIAGVAAVLIALTIPSCNSVSGWNDAPDTQYHIQTDEGPERYFKYQTISGQYRKEKRLEDGTVIGSYGWVDADGFLRMRDYIADNQGYRILKTKNVFVGKDRAIGQAVQVAKNAPAEAGELVDHRQKVEPIYRRPVVEEPFVEKKIAPLYNRYNRPPIQVAGYRPNTTPEPIRGYVEITPKVTPISGYSTPTPYVEISHNSIKSSTASPVPSSTIEPPSTIYISSTPSPIPSTNYLPSTTPKPPITPDISNDLDYTPEGSFKRNQIKYNNPYIYQNGPTYPIDRNGNTFNTYSSNQVGGSSGYESNQQQYPYYDGVAVTNDGFRYYLPRQYHEEQNPGGDTRAGSFGYIDPFGIRRVVYYNTSPGSGFQHRKNNRYVGFDATPYDPRPYR